jgi:hypothetical protein
MSSYPVIPSNTRAQRVNLNSLNGGSDNRFDQMIVELRMKLLRVRYWGFLKEEQECLNLR